MARVSMQFQRPRVTAATRRRIDLRRRLWPDITERDLWDRREFKGFTTIPRTLALIVRIIDEIDRKNAGRVYFDLWCRSFDDYLIEIRDEYEAAYSSGYDGQRAVRTWRERMGVLDGAGFIRTQRASHGAYRTRPDSGPAHGRRPSKQGEQGASRVVDGAELLEDLHRQQAAKPRIVCSVNPTPNVRKHRSAPPIASGRRCRPRARSSTPASPGEER